MANPAWTEGTSGNPNGRPKGSENKETKKIRAWIGAFLEKNLQQFEDDINSLEPKERVNAISNLMEYAVPKLARVENVGDNGGALQIEIIRHASNTSPSERTPSSPESDNTGSEAV